MHFVLSKKVKPFVRICGGVCAGIILSACSEPKTTEVSLKPIDIQGSSFNETVAESNPQTSPTEVLHIAELTTATQNQLETTVDIAKIPTATPIPTYAIRETPEPAEAPVAAPVKVGDYAATPFDLLGSYKYVEPIPEEGEKPEEVEKRRLNDQIPPNILALNGTKAIVEGWMVPMEVRDDGTVKSFILVKTQPQCCFGDTQAMNEWIDVTVNAGNRVEFNVDTPIKVFGELEVGEKTDEGFVISIYRMKADKVEG